MAKQKYYNIYNLVVTDDEVNFIYDKANKHIYDYQDTDEIKKSRIVAKHYNAAVKLRKKIQELTGKHDDGG